MKTDKFVLAALFSKAVSSKDCSGSQGKVDCGYPGVTQQSCEDKGCCWVPVEAQNNLFLAVDQSTPDDTPWCFNAGSGPTPPPSPECDVSTGERLDCGQLGSTEADCEAAGCCWSPVDIWNPFEDPFKLSDTPWCFYKKGANPCPAPTWDAKDPGFTDDFVALMQKNFEANLNIQGSGAVVAAPDHNTPGGNYYYHWMRDGALSSLVYMQVNDNDYSKVHEVMTAYQGWVKTVQNKQDPNNIDVRVEPKFEIPSGDPYTGGWCRPQNDGPGLRANTLAKWGAILVNNKMEDQAKNDVWPLMKNDLDWVMENWLSDGCDLWEEIHSDDIFWNRMSQVYSLRGAADFADLIGESGDDYRSKADEIEKTLDNHWNGDYLWQSSNREKDGAVIHAITTFGGKYGPTSKEAAATIKNYNTAFCLEWKINQHDNDAGVPGILYGRYLGDHYAGGNPWQLLTAVLAECFYKGAVAMKEQMLENNGNDFPLATEEYGEWMDLLNLVEGSTASDYVAAATAAGDSVMTRLWTHVKDDGGEIDEQIDRETGAQKSAKNLTWSYANVLNALHVRKNL